MSKYIGPKLKLCRREKKDLFLKSGIKPIDKKCKLNQTPGQIHIKKFRISEYNLQLREKQKLKRLYLISEKQFFNYYKKCNKKFSNIIELLLQKLELRLDNIVYKLGFSSTILEARQIINHKHIKVNNFIINKPSYNVKINDIIKIKNNFNKEKLFFSIKMMKNKEPIPWLKLYFNELYGKILYIPKIKDFPKDINSNLIMEFYSK